MSDTAQLLDDAFDRLLSRLLSGVEARRADGLTEVLLADVLEAGFTRVLAPETANGLGGTLREAANIAWRAGWHTAPLPIVEMLLLAYLDPDADAATVTLAQGTPAIAPTLRSTRVIQTPHGRRPVDQTRPFAHLSGMEWRALDGDAGDYPARTQRMGALLTSAAMLGAMARVMQIVRDHATTRRQFARPLSKFQSIQHHLAQAQSELTLTQAALANALDAHDAGHGGDLLWRSAKAQAGMAATTIAAIAHQVMGAVGFTEDHELHHFTKLLWQWRDSWGRQVACEQAIGKEACAAPEGLWTYITEKHEETT